MKTFISLITLAILLSNCVNRAPSDNLLNQRADYGNTYALEDAIQKTDRQLFVPKRTQPVIADIWLFPKELPSGDYFTGGWVRTIIKKPIWQLEPQRIDQPKEKQHDRK